LQTSSYSVVVVVARTMATVVAALVVSYKSPTLTYRSAHLQSLLAQEVQPVAQVAPRKLAPTHRQAGATAAHHKPLGALVVPVVVVATGRQLSVAPR
jgi:hypothetical protein